jgi:chromosome segregation protein
MFLKALSMKGFKSFADPTVLELEPGITVVVGPNGSGKSNVVDAVTWVLGAQGRRSLRSQRMEDVIFAGTSSRPALGRAEVSLTIDNSSGKLPVDVAEVTITRTLFRSGDSEYAINGTACRLLDVQDLLSDSGVGRQQHMIIGQGQLDTVLNARPEERRALIEEAAGVLKHRRRRERAERRLEATQVNLERLGDLVRELRRQIRPLERQAAAARSHAALATELRAVRVHVAGTELEALAARRRAAAEGLAALNDEERTLHAALGALDAQAAAATAELSSRREEDLASALGRVQALVERARGTANVLRERARALAAALDAAADVDVVSTLEAESSRLAAELAAAEDDERALAPERDGLASAAAQLDAAEVAYRERWGDVASSEPEGALAEARRRMELHRLALEQDRRSLRSTDDRLGALESRVVAMDAAARDLQARCDTLETEAARLADAVRTADDEHRAARAQAEEADRAAQAAEQDRHRSAARAEALARALRELDGAAGREILAGVDGVVGSLVDLVEIDPGWEAAFEAAAGASVAAVVVSGRSAAREALSRLHRQRATGALLATRRSGPVDIGGGPERVPDLPPGARPVRPHVRLRRSAASAQGAGVDAVLDVLVGRVVRVEGWEAALEVALDRPDLVVVTAEGDRFADSGWRVRSAKGVVTAAAVEDAEARAAEAARWADQATAQQRDARRAMDEAAAASVAAGRALDRHEAARAAARAELRRAGEERERIATELADGRRLRDEAAAAIEDDERALSALEEAVPSLEEAAETAAARVAEAETARAELDRRRVELAAIRQSLEVRVAGLAERHKVLGARHAEVERRLAGHARERVQAAERRQRLESDGVALTRLDAVVGKERARLETVLGSLRADYRQQMDEVRASAVRMEDIRRQRAVAEQRLDEARATARQLDREVAEATLRQEALSEMVATELGTTAAEARRARAPDLPDGVTAAARAADLASRLAALGPVNPLALEELSALEERHRELDVQTEDVRAARRQLHEVVRTLDREIAETFAAAAADVNEHFSQLIGDLFPGGSGRLSLTAPDDLLNTGVEVEVRPAGRNVHRVSLLSGGERSMAALAFLFAVFRSRPSPFYLMDEVEAALDDVNLHRFLGLVREFRAEAQLIIVSHQKRTMEAADALYGVTMAPGGSSQVISQKASRRSPEPVP